MHEGARSLRVGKRETIWLDNSKSKDLGCCDVDHELINASSLPDEITQTGVSVDRSEAPMTYREGADEVESCSMLYPLSSQETIVSLARDLPKKGTIDTSTSRTSYTKSHDVSFLGIIKLSNSTPAMSTMTPAD
jgi:hypothetical protein